MRAGIVVIILTAWLGCGILSGSVWAGTYIYHDAEGREVRDLPKPERRGEPGEREDAGRSTRRRGGGETPARFFVERDTKPSSRSQR